MRTELSGELGTSYRRPRPRAAGHLAYALALAVSACTPALPAGKFACDGADACPHGWVCERRLATSSERRCYQGPGPHCGDGVVTSPEVCDGTNVGKASCYDHFFYYGNVSCNESCTALDFSQCRSYCGDGIVDPNFEECDGGPPDGPSCPGVVLGAYGCTASCRERCETGNPGRAWNGLGIIVDAPELMGVWGTGPSDVTAVGASGEVVHFDGTGWHMRWRSPRTEFRLRASWFAAADDIYAVDRAGGVRHFDGHGWTPMDNGGRGALVGIGGRSSQDLFAVGGSGTVLHLDGTGRWQPVDVGASDDLLAVSESGGPTQGSIFIAGANGILLHSADGVVWDRWRSGVVERLTAVWAVSQGSAFVAGQVVRFCAGGKCEPTPGNSGGMRAIWGRSASDVFAVGGTVASHFDGCSWTPVPSGLLDYILAPGGKGHFTPGLVAAGCNLAPGADMVVGDDKAAFLPQLPSDPDCATSIPIYCNQTFRVGGDTSGGSSVVPLLDCGRDVPGAAVVYQLEAPQDAVATARLFPVAADLDLLALADDSAVCHLPGGTCLAASHNEGLLPEELQFAVKRGSTYYIAVAGAGPETSGYWLSLQCEKDR